MEETDRHHVPPRRPDANPRFIKRKDSRHHRAYHLLFAAAKSYEDACLILWHDWWEQAEDDSFCRHPGSSENVSCRSDKALKQASVKLAQNTEE